MSHDRQHNQPPEPLAEQTYAEQMLDESGKHRARADELVKALTAEDVPESEEDAARVTMLANMAAGHRKEMDTRRDALKRPHDDRSADVQRAWAPWIKDLDAQIARARTLMDTRARRLEAAAREMERHAAEQAAAERRKAEEADKAAQQAQDQGDASGALRNELEAIQARERAERLGAEGFTAPSVQVRTQVGMATQSRRPEVDIVNWREAVNWLMRHKREQFKELVLQLVKEAVRGKVIPDGVEVHNVPTTRFAR